MAKETYISLDVSCFSKATQAKFQAWRNALEISQKAREAMWSAAQEDLSQAAGLPDGLECGSGQVYKMGFFGGPTTIQVAVVDAPKAGAGKAKAAVKFTLKRGK